MAHHDYDALRASFQGSTKRWRNRANPAEKRRPGQPRDDFALAIGARLAGLRLSRGVSLRRLSILMAQRGVPYSHDTIAKWERGTIDIPMRGFLAICAALQAPPTALLAKNWSARIDQLVPAPHLPTRLRKPAPTENVTP